MFCKIIIMHLPIWYLGLKYRKRLYAEYYCRGIPIRAPCTPSQQALVHVWSTCCNMHNITVLATINLLLYCFTSLSGQRPHQLVLVYRDLQRCFSRRFLFLYHDLTTSAVFGWSRISINAGAFKFHTKEKEPSSIFFFLPSTIDTVAQSFPYLQQKGFCVSRQKDPCQCAKLRKSSSSF
jgi:hypothetical protein